MSQPFERQLHPTGSGRRMPEQAGGLRRPFAVFDIDGTLIRWQLYHAVVDKLAKHGHLGPTAREQLHEARMVWKRREYKDAFKDYEKRLIQLYETGIKKITPAAFDDMVAEVINEYKDQAYTYTRDLINGLKQRGYKLFIISGSHHELIEQIAKHYGFDDWLGTRYERSRRGFSGQRQVASHDKKAGLAHMAKRHKVSFKGSLAIGDSESDIAMMELVEQPVAFNPSQGLFDHATQHGWRIVVERKNVIYELEKVGDEYHLAKAKS